MLTLRGFDEAHSVAPPKSKVSFQYHDHVAPEAGDKNRNGEDYMDIFLKRYPFSERILALLEAPEHVISGVEEELRDFCKNSGYLSVSGVFLSSICSSSFIRETFIQKRCCFRSLNYGKEGENTIAILPNGQLILTVDEMTFQVLGIESRVRLPHHIRNGTMSGFRVISIDLVKSEHGVIKPRQDRLLSRISELLNDMHTSSVALIGNLSEEFPLSSLLHFGRELQTILRNNGSRDAEVNVAPLEFTHKKYKGGNLLRNSMVSNPFATRALPHPDFSAACKIITSDNDDLHSETIQEILDFLGHVHLDIPVVEKFYDWVSFQKTDVGEYDLFALQGEFISLTHLRQISSIYQGAFRRRLVPSVSYFSHDFDQRAVATWGCFSVFGFEAPLSASGKLHDFYSKCLHVINYGSHNEQERRLHQLMLSIVRAW